MEPLLPIHQELLNQIAKAEATKSRSDGYFDGWVYLKHGNLIASIKANGWPPLLHLSERLVEQGLLETNQEDTSLVRLTEAGRNYLNGSPQTSNVYTKKVPLDLTNMHQRVCEIAGPLATDGHYRQAVLDTFIGLVGEVQQKTQLSRDGVPLMQEAFTEKNPVLKFAERDEQMGYMWLYSGAVMTFRNVLSHRLTSMDDPTNALEVLGFASHLFRALDNLANPATKVLEPQQNP